MRPALAKGQIAAQNGESRFRKRMVQSREQLRLTVRSCAVREDYGVPVGGGRLVQKSADGWLG